MGKLIKVLQPTDWSFKPMDDFIKNGGEAFSVSRFGYEILKDKVDLTWIVPPKDKLLTRFFESILGLEGSNLILQIMIIKQSRNYDVIYYSADRHPYLIAIARKLGIIKTPILMLCHFSYDHTSVDNFLKKLILKIERNLVFSCMDQIVFNCENLMQLAINRGNLPQKHRKLSYWGASLEYFSHGNSKCFAEYEPYYFAAGGANRDYHTLFEAFKKMPYRLIVSCPREVIEAEDNISQNIIFFDYKKHGFESYDILRSYYLGCKAVLLPIKHRNHVANGASVMVEAMACSKPVIVTDLETNFVDVETEKIGFKTKINDVKSWVDVITKIERDNIDLKEYGNNSYKLAKEKYNYELFADTIFKEICLLGGR